MKWSSLILMGAMVALLLLMVGPAKANPDAALVGTYWRAVEIDGNPVTPQSEKREAHLVLMSEGKRVSGSTGCNRFTGTFEQTADGYRFSKMAVTKMACPPPLDALERAFLQALGVTASVRISENTLEMIDASGRVRMRLEAGPTKATNLQSAQVTGTVTYLQRMALPPDAVVHVKLLDVSLQDAPARLLKEQIITNPSQQVPIPFEIEYDPAAIDPRHTYAVQVRITTKGRPIFITTSAYHVITRGNPTHIELIVEKVGKKPR
jgi:heat shock protein HslJ